MPKFDVVLPDELLGRFDGSLIVKAVQVGA
jgi:hypothetical protein